MANIEYFEINDEDVNEDDVVENDFNLSPNFKFSQLAIPEFLKTNSNFVDDEILRAKYAKQIWIWASHARSIKQMRELALGILEPLKKRLDSKYTGKFIVRHGIVTRPIARLLGFNKLDIRQQGKACVFEYRDENNVLVDISKDYFDDLDYGKIVWYAFEKAMFISKRTQVWSKNFNITSLPVYQLKK